VGLGVLTAAGCAGTPRLAHAAHPRPGTAPWRYTLRIDAPTTQFVHVAIDVPGGRNTSTDLALPAWTPGSYLIRDFTRHVYDVQARGPDGEALAVHKLDKQTWRVEHGRDGFRVTYRVFADELSVRTSYVDDQLALLNGASLFMYEPGATDRAAHLALELPPDWRAHTPLDTADGGGYGVPSYDALVDSPLLLGRAEVRTFTVGNATFEYVFDATVPVDVDVDRLTRDAETIVQAFHRLMGDFPFQRYVFLALSDPAGGGGLEHERGCAMILRPETFERPGGYDRARSLLAHEFFHLWNVKRIHDRKLGPFDYAREVYTDLLWFHEGFTETMEKRALLEAEFTDPGGFVADLESGYNAYLRRPGRNHEPIAQISRDAWIKAYQPSPAHWNTSVSYYQKGDIIGATLDAELRARAARHDRSGSLPGLFAELWSQRDPDTQRVAITMDDIVKAASGQAGEDMQWFFDRYVLGTDEVDLPGALRRLGMNVSEQPDTAPFTGLRGRGTAVASIAADSPAQKAGLMIGDEIIAVDGQKIEGLDAIAAAGEIETKVRLTAFRRGVLIERELVLAKSPYSQYRFELPESPSPALARFAGLQ